MSKYFASRNIKTSSSYTEKIKNVEMMKNATTSTTPTIDYTLQGKVFEQFLNYETYLSLVKGFTDMRSILCEDCKCNLQSPMSIVEGINSFTCGELTLCDKCKTTLYPYGRFINQTIEEEAFKFPRKITTDPCLPKIPKSENCNEIKEICNYNTYGYVNTMQPCCAKQTRPKCVPTNCPPKCHKTCLQRICDKKCSCSV